MAVRIDKLRMERSLNLEGTVGAKPCINDMIDEIAEEIYSRSRRNFGSVLLNVRDWYHRAFSGDDFDDDDDMYDGCGNYLGSSRRKRRGRSSKAYWAEGDLFDDYGTHRASRKKRNRGRKKKASTLDWENGDYDAAELRAARSHKRIVFYIDVERGDIEGNYIEFSSLKLFNDYCERKGYDVLPQDASNLAHWDVIHCCVDPYMRNSIVTERSFGSLLYTVDPDGAQGYVSYSD